MGQIGGNDSYVVSLLHMNGTDGSQVFTDNAANGTHTWAYGGGAQIDTAQNKFGGASGWFDGTGDYIDTGDSPDWSFGSGDFTIDLWFRRNGIGTNQYICGQMASNGASNTCSWYLWLEGSSNKLYGGIYTTGVAGHSIPTLAGITSTTTWYHATMIRNVNTLYFYLGGVQQGTHDITGLSLQESANKLAIGRCGEYNGSYFNGWVDEFRVSKGIARWTSDFPLHDSAYYVRNPRPQTGFFRSQNV